MLRLTERNYIITSHLRFNLAIIIFIILNSYCLAQEIDTIQINRKDAINIFIDCPQSIHCDYDYIRKEITFVNYVRDRNDAQVHILITTQYTAVGGIEYTLTFFGQQEFTNINDTLKFLTKLSDSEEIKRKELVRTLKLGLIRYINKTPLVDKISITYQEPTKPTEIIDEWDFWFFRTSIHGWFNGEKSYVSNSINGSISANRVTEDLKVNISLYSNYNERKYEYGEYSSKVFSRGGGLSSRIITSISEHFSVGVFSSISTSTYNNTKKSLSFGPAIEYNIFPYKLATRKEFRLQYKINFTYIEYNEETIYNKTLERLFNESASISFDIKEPWGSIGFSGWASHYFHDIKKYNLGVWGQISLKLIEGLSVDINGNVSYNRDQLSLPRGEATQEQVLLRQRELETQYRYFASVGISYTFGSIYSNIVNPRFGNGGSYRFIFYD